MPWRKPTLYVLNELTETSGSPALKIDPTNVLESENEPPFNRGKLYRPISA